MKTTKVLIAVLCAPLLWVVYLVIGMIEVLIFGVLQFVWGLVLLGASLAVIVGVLAWILTQ